MSLNSDCLSNHSGYSNEDLESQSFRATSLEVETISSDSAIKIVI